MNQRDDETKGEGETSGKDSPRYRLVADALRERISSGAMARGSKFPPLRQIADEFDVSTMAVRQALELLEEKGYAYRVAGIGAFVQTRIPGQAGSVTTIALMARDLGVAFCADIARGVGKACQERGWSLQIVDTRFDLEVVSRSVLGMLNSGIDGAILVPPLYPEIVDILLQDRLPRCPLVLADSNVPGFRADRVESDHENGAYRATTHMLQQGHAQVVMITHRPVMSSVAERIQGYERALKDAPRAPTRLVAWVDPEKQDAGYKQGRKWLGGCEAILPVLKELDPPVAVLAVDAYVGWGAYEACHKLQLRIPEDVSIMAFDDLEIASAIRPPMSIVSQRTDDIGHEAVDLLARRIEANRQGSGIVQSYTHTIIDVDLILRQSVATVTTNAEPTP